MNAMVYQCQNCGTRFRKWGGKCDECGAWNTITEETSIAVQGKIKKHLSKTKAENIQFHDLVGTTAPALRLESGVGEFDRVCGGGLVQGSAILVGGDPGIGKSTLLLQVLAALSQHNEQQKLVYYYISGEEGIEQIRMRARRLEISNRNILLAANNELQTILQAMDKMPKSSVLVVDSIQTLYTDALESAPGTVAQVRTCASELIRLAKQKDICLILVGHVTKEGAIAGPRVLEHMVDCVLYFEGERNHQFRILRTVKNRFGATDEIGVFEMTELGLKEVLNPSALFIKDRLPIAGSCVFVGVEGTRPVLMEIQTLISPSSFGTPRRSVVGWDPSRLSMILAVLETRCQLPLGAYDIYLNVAGGLRIQEPAADLAVAAALMSSALKKALNDKLVIFGEVGLGGEIRSVGHINARLKEAIKLGFHTSYIPPQPKAPMKEIEHLIKTKEIATLGMLFKLMNNPEINL